MLEQLILIIISMIGGILAGLCLSFDIIAWRLKHGNLPRGLKELDFTLPDKWKKQELKDGAK